ncbi:uncharacterized protein LOC119192610, partial [Manduca sexta]|uniref:uncharacterized protein LOC119192610 n=1 Tax=Manduca sexta TaxID=7130 RepID=UPI00188E44E5
MKDKRLEVKLSVRGDGSLSRNSLRSSTRSDRSNLSNNSGLPVSEIFATDRFSAPHSRPFDTLDKYRRQPNQRSYIGQSMPALNQYQPQPVNTGYGIRDRRNPYIDYAQPVDTRPYYTQSQYFNDMGQMRYEPVYNDSYAMRYGTLPRAASRMDGPNTDANYNASNNYTLPMRAGPRRVRISELEPIVYGYGESVSERAESETRLVGEQRC